jgi:predicted O-methyltransferase YrrM
MSHRNLIYCCVFENRNYLKLAKLLVESLNMNGSLDESTDVLVMTHPSFEEELLRTVKLSHKQLLTYTLEKSSLFEAGCARLDIFSYPHIDKYDKILYIDTDILFEDSPSRLFNIDIYDNKMYVYSEGTVSDPYHGKHYWNLNGIDPQTTAFTTGVLFFRNGEPIRTLFSEIKNHIHEDIHVNKGYIPGCLDQPFIVYNTIIRNLHDGLLLSSHMRNLPYENLNGKPKSSHFKPAERHVLYHFFGGLGDFNNKYSRMTDFIATHFIKAPVYDKEAITTQFEDKRPIFESHLESLEKIVRSTGDILEGNSVYYHQSLNRFHELLPKQINLFWAGLSATQRICEIGFNAGHSALLMLLGRSATPLIFTIFDIEEHKYVKPTMEYIARQFSHVVFDYTPGDSTQIIPSWIAAHPHVEGTYDVVHVDGGHSYHCIQNDMKNAAILVRVGGIIIVDDVYFTYINDTVNQYISTGNFREVDCLLTVGYTHRIIQRVI